MTSFREVAETIARECLGTRVRKTSRLLTRIYDEAVRPLGLQESQLSVLVAVAKFGERGATIGDLATALAMDRTTMTRSVRPLERSGWVQVARDPGDARRRSVVLTRAGERLLEASYKEWKRAQEKVRALLGAARFGALRSSLDEALSLCETS